jgi:hypothetical protein
MRHNPVGRSDAAGVAARCSGRPSLSEFHRAAARALCAQMRYGFAAGSALPLPGAGLIGIRRTDRLSARIEHPNASSIEASGVTGRSKPESRRALPVRLGDPRTPSGLPPSDNRGILRAAFRREYRDSRLRRACTSAGCRSPWRPAVAHAVTGKSALRVEHQRSRERLCHIHNPRRGDRLDGRRTADVRPHKRALSEHRIIRWEHGSDVTAQGAERGASAGRRASRSLRAIASRSSTAHAAASATLVSTTYTHSARCCGATRHHRVLQERCEGSQDRLRESRQLLVGEL